MIGTLAPFTKARDPAVPYPEIKALLPELLHLPRTRTAIISGRAIADLIRLIGVQPLPELWGSHGWEYRSGSGDYMLFPLPIDLQERLNQGAAIVRAINIPDVLEEKPASVAAHWRGNTPETQRLHSTVYPNVYPFGEPRLVDYRSWSGASSSAPRCRSRNGGSRPYSRPHRRKACRRTNFIARWA